MLFDGECVLCSGTVRFVLAHERAPTLLFATTQSETGRALAARHDLSAADLDRTFALIEDGTVHLRSAAALRVAAHLRAPWRWLVALRLVPRPVRDAGYTALARRRYILFGRREACFLPEPAQRHRFLLDPQ
jgi:predicted DCC family thiol-disulfide oxidoreductase YuxK